MIIEKKYIRIFLCLFSYILLCGLDSSGETLLRAELSKTDIKHYHHEDAKIISKYILSLNEDSISISYLRGNAGKLNEVSRYSEVFTLSQKHEVEKCLSSLSRSACYSARFMVGSVWSGNIIINPGKSDKRGLSAKKALRLYENIINLIPMQPNLYKTEYYDITPGFESIRKKVRYKYPDDIIIEYKYNYYSEGLDTAPSIIVNNDSLYILNAVKKETKKIKLLKPQKDLVLNILSQINPKSEFSRGVGTLPDDGLLYNDAPAIVRIKVGDKIIYYNNFCDNHPLYSPTPYARLIVFLDFFNGNATTEFETADSEGVLSQDKVGLRAAGSRELVPVVVNGIKDFHSIDPIVEALKDK